MKRLIIGTILTLTGVALLVFRRKFADIMISLNRDTILGFPHKFGKFEKRLMPIMTVFFGLLFTALGILVLMGVID